MSDNSAIEWTNASWNPVTGCTRLSAGCDHCYAERFSERFRDVAGHPFEPGFDLTLRPERLDQPARWRRPRLIFVNSMSDLFHKNIPAEFLGRVFDTMEQVDRHVYQVLTKRSSLMRSFVNRRYAGKPPPAHIWLGVSIENASTLGRLRHLKQTRAAVRFVSFEPLLGPVGEVDLAGIHWVIAGGESGPGARPVDADWLREIRDRCQAGRVAFFFKQWGGRSPKSGGNELDGRQWQEYPAHPRPSGDEGRSGRSWPEGRLRAAGAPPEDGGETMDVGPWAREKLTCLGKYLHAYTTIMRRQRFKGYFYVDAFAGPGALKVRRQAGDPAQQSLLEVAAHATDDADEERYITQQDRRLHSRKSAETRRTAGDMTANTDTAMPKGSAQGRTLADAPTFIETQFPVSRLSKESYKERKANYSQTLTGLGKWWGRKPLVMVRAILLGLLMPASNDPRKDRDVFLALLTMDEEGLWRRKSRNVPLKEVYRRLSPEERTEWFASGTDPDRPKLKTGTKAADRERLQRIVFECMGYDEKLRWCDRPEHLDGPSPDAWKVINQHLGTKAASLPELVRALGERRFGRVPRVGDAFCGGGSVPFEAARLGCEAWGSDLNPVAALLTWGALNIVGGGAEVAERIRAAQTEVFEAVDRQVTEWRIEHDAAGWRADAFLYCTETACPECGWRVPLAPSWVIGEKTRAVARLTPEPAERRFAIDVRSGVGRDALAAARDAGTVKQSRLECPNPDCRASTPMAAIRGDRRGDGGRGHGLRQWENDDLVPRPDDVFQERLYCVRGRLPSLAALLWAEQRARATCRVEGDAGGVPAPRKGVPIPEHLDSRFRGNDGAEVGGMTEAGGASVSDQDTPIPEGLRAEASAGGVAAVLEGARRNFHAGETPAFPGASGMPEVARRDAHAGETPAPRKGTETPDASPPPVPDWVDLECAITALVELLEPDEQREVAELRERDWLAEDRAVEQARHEFEAGKSAGRPKRELTTAAERLRKSREAAARRNDRVEALARSLPGALYRPVDDADLEREARALALLRERFPEWQALGYLPSREITPGAKTDEPIRTRGWTHWHHLFTPRQLLTLGAISSEASSGLSDKNDALASILGLSRCADYNSRLSRWHPHRANEKSEQVFSNQALNTMLSFAGRGLPALDKAFLLDLGVYKITEHVTAIATDARATTVERDIWLTDPPYADAINYHELSEFFLAWYEKWLPELFPDWYTDSKRALAVQGADADFRRNMVDCYRNLTSHMTDNGLQIVMFTHQDASVWADLTLILWAAGLRVTAAWTIATETESALKEGNYVQGTVLMVLRKQTTGETAFLDEVVPEVEAEVERQLASMLALDDREDPNFSDADYQLAAYAAALRVLTQYGSIEDIDVSYELSRERRRDEPNPIEKIIGDAVRTASNFLVPTGLPKHLWRGLAPEEKLYVKGLDIERRGDFRSGVYQEFARGFGVRDYRYLLHTGKANRTRLKTASEFKRGDLGDTAFGRSLVRHALYAVWRAAESGEVADSLTWLRTELPDYWPQREAMATVLRYLAAIDVDHWRADAAAARLVAGAVENDHI